MIALVVLALAAQAQPSDADLMAELERNRIDVTAEQLRGFRARWDMKDDGIGVCKIKRSTGKTDLDVLACDAVKSCAEANRELIARRTNRKLPRNERREIKSALKQEMTECAAERFAALKTEYGARPLSSATDF